MKSYVPTAYRQIDSSFIPDRPRREQIDHEMRVAEASRPLIPLVVNSGLSGLSAFFWTIFVLAVGVCVGVLIAPALAHADCHPTSTGAWQCDTPYNPQWGYGVQPTLPTQQPTTVLQPTLPPLPPLGTHECFPQLVQLPDGTFVQQEVCR